MSLLSNPSLSIRLERERQYLSAWSYSFRFETMVRSLTDFSTEATMAETKARAARPKVEDPEKERDDWVSLLDQLVALVNAWVQSDWATKVIKKSMGDSVLGEYDAPALLMQRDTTRVLLEPITRFAPGADGVIDLYRMPAYDDIASLYREDGDWKLHYAFQGGKTNAGTRTVDPLPFTKENFLRVLNAIAVHVA
jgi:hypothetical protein